MKLSRVTDKKRTRPGWAGRCMVLLALVAALLPLASGVAVALDWHAGAAKNPDCAICKSFDDLSSGAQQEPASLQPPECIEVSFAAEAYFSVCSISPSTHNTRAPPLPHPAEQCS